jgi:hypothetical protein
VAERSLSNGPVITKPQITKKTSTPTQPSPRTPAWKRTTRRTCRLRLTGSESMARSLPTQLARPLAAPPSPLPVGQEVVLLHLGCFVLADPCPHQGRQEFGRQFAFVGKLDEALTEFEASGFNHGLLGGKERWIETK